MFCKYQTALEDILSGIIHSSRCYYCPFMPSISTITHQSSSRWDYVWGTRGSAHPSVHLIFHMLKQIRFVNVSKAAVIFLNWTTAFNDSNMISVILPKPLPPQLCTLIELHWNMLWSSNCFPQQGSMYGMLLNVSGCQSDLPRAAL